MVVSPIIIPFGYLLESTNHEADINSLLVSLSDTILGNTPGFLSGSLVGIKPGALVGNWYD